MDAAEIAIVAAYSFVMIWAAYGFIQIYAVRVDDLLEEDIVDHHR